MNRAANPPDYYTLLQISPEASQIDIINAYRHAKLAYQQDSLAIYSLFSGQELEQIQIQIEEAYRVLSNPEKRRSYDARQLQPGINTDQSPQPGGNVIPLHKQNTGSPHHAAAEQQAGACATCSGEALKGIREAKNITLEHIAQHTKISKRYLQAIEDEDAENFPETAYLKGYLRQYASEIGLDPDEIVRCYPPLAGHE
ncbi:MAG: helix-turn-helix domain-containing protein [Mariprofundaceae bacterium]|nr:helix-turn-helix domain-containing protein [Mariprofundaceae bacterium]